ncbi:hypothetical protein AZA_00338 [Nitrospirillum viridazoti Y2]|nr:hypothetical protein AZA_00338 [Nitrospirillum amazonense Y2]
MAGHVECARRLTVGAGDRDVAGQGDVRPAVADGMVGDIDGIAQADSTRREAEVAQAVVDGAAAEQPRRRAGATHDHQIMAAGVEQVADQGATVGQRAQAAAGRDVHRCGGGEGAGVGKIAQGTADIVVADHRQQVGARHALAHHQTGEAALDHHAEVAGADTAGHQRVHACQVVTGGAVLGDNRAAAETGGPADGQAAMGRIRQGQGAGRLAVGAGDTDQAVQDYRGAAVDQGVAGHVQGVVQQQVAGGEIHVAEGVDDAALAAGGVAGQGTHHRAAAAGDAQVVGRQVQDVAGDGAAVGQNAQAGAGVDVQSCRRRDQAAVGQRTDGPGVIDAIGGAQDGAAVQHRGDVAGVVQPGGRRGAGIDQGAIVDDHLDGAGVVQRHLAGDGAAVAERADAGTRLVAQAGNAAGDGAGIAQGADGAAVDHTGDGAADRAVVAEATHGTGVGDTGDGTGDGTAVGQRADGAVVDHAHHAARQRAAVADTADAAAAADIEGGDGNDGTGIAQRGKGAADVVVGNGGHQVGVGADAHGAGGRRQARHVHLGEDTGVAGAGAADHQGA